MPGVDREDPVELCAVSSEERFDFLEEVFSSAAGFSAGAAEPPPTVTRDEIFLIVDLETPARSRSSTDE